MSSVSSGHRLAQNNYPVSLRLLGQADRREGQVEGVGQKHVGASICNIRDEQLKIQLLSALCAYSKQNMGKVMQVKLLWHKALKLKITFFGLVFKITGLV